MGVAALGRAVGLAGVPPRLGEQPAMTTAAATAAPVLIKPAGSSADSARRPLGGLPEGATWCSTHTRTSPGNGGASAAGETGSFRRVGSTNKSAPRRLA